MGQPKKTVVRLNQAYDTWFKHTVNFIHPQASYARIKRTVFSGSDIGFTEESFRVFCSQESINDVRIYGGREAGPHEFPFVAALQRTAYGASGASVSDRFLCGATILSPKVALSAAHCVEGVRTSELLVVAGESNRAAGTKNARVEP